MPRRFSKRPDCCKVRVGSIGTVTAARPMTEDATGEINDAFQRSDRKVPLGAA